MERHSLHAALASGAMTGQAAFELLRVATDRPWPGYGAIPSHPISIALAVLCLTTAVVLQLRRTDRRFGEAAFFLGIVTTLALAAHAAFTLWAGRVFAGSYSPLLVVAVALFVGFNVKRTFDGRELARLRQLRPAHQ